MPDRPRGQSVATVNLALPASLHGNAGNHSHVYGSTEQTVPGKTWSGLRIAAERTLLALIRGAMPWR